MQPMPPDTTVYMMAGYVVMLGGILLYLVSLWVRYRQVQADMALLEEIDSEARKMHP